MDSMVRTKLSEKGRLNQFYKKKEKPLRNCNRYVDTSEITKIVGNFYETFLCCPLSLPDNKLKQMLNFIEL